VLQAFAKFLILAFLALTLASCSDPESQMRNSPQGELLTEAFNAVRDNDLEKLRLMFSKKLFSTIDGSEKQSELEQARVMFTYANQAIRDQSLVLDRFVSLKSTQSLGEGYSSKLEAIIISEVDRKNGYLAKADYVMEDNKLKFDDIKFQQLTNIRPVGLVQFVKDAPVASAAMAITLLASLIGVLVSVLYPGLTHRWFWALFCMVGIGKLSFALDGTIQAFQPLWLVVPPASNVSFLSFGVHLGPMPATSGFHWSFPIGLFLTVLMILEVRRNRRAQADA
jgi:hypothetical protein